MLLSREVIFSNAPILLSDHQLEKTKIADPDPCHLRQNHFLVTIQADEGKGIFQPFLLQHTDPLPPSSVSLHVA